MSRNVDIRVKKGTSVYRVSSEDEKLRDSQTYISILKSDHARYLIESSKPGASVGFDVTYGKNKNEGRPYNLKLELKKDLIAPSYNETMKSFIKTFENVKFKEVSDYMNVHKDTAKDFVKDFSKMSMEEARDRAYKNFSKTLMNDSKARQIFFDDLKRKGYNAVVDENDTDYTESPVIVFEASKTLKKVSSQKMSAKDKEYLRDLYYSNVEDEYPDAEDSEYRHIKKHTKLKF